MPWKVFTDGNQYCVHKVSEDGNTRLGRVACHSSRAKANAQLRALYASEEKAMSDQVEALETAEEQEEKSYDEIYHSHFATSFEELDQIRDAQKKSIELSDLINDFTQIAQNIALDPEIDDKAGAISSLGNEFATRSNSIATEKKSFTEHIKDFITGGNKEKEKSRISGSPLVITKDKEGRWKWFATYSNNFRDRDNPPEIISLESHRRFVERTEKGLAPLPELQIWHTKSLTIGKAAWVAVDEHPHDTGFAVAAGYFLPGCEGIAEALRDAKDVGLSHGMPISSIKRDSKDKSIIIEHDTAEISVLPQIAAANELNGFSILKEIKEDNMIDKKKLEGLEALGLDKTLLESVMDSNAERADKAVEGGREHKDVTEDEQEAAMVEAEDVQEADEPVESGEEAGSEADTSATEENPEDLPPSRKELANALKSVLDPMIEKINENATLLKELGERLEKREKSVDDEVQHRVENASQASLLAMITGSSTKDTGSIVPDDDPLSNAGPQENEDKQKSSPEFTPIPFINDWLVKDHGRRG